MSGISSIPDEWILHQSVFHRLLLWLAWKAKGQRVCLSVREIAYALQVSKGTAERALEEVKLAGLISTSPVPVSKIGTFYDLKGLLWNVSQEVSQLSMQPEILGHKMGHETHKDGASVSVEVKPFNMQTTELPELELGRELGRKPSVPASVPKLRRLPPSKREKEREKMLRDYHADTGTVFEALNAIWPEERSNGTKIGCPFADTVARIDERLQEGVPAGDLIEAAKLYLDENKGYESEIRFFFGPGKPGSGMPKWAKYVKAIRFSSPTQVAVG